MTAYCGGVHAVAFYGHDAIALLENLGHSRVHLNAEELQGMLEFWTEIADTRRTCGLFTCVRECRKLARITTT